MRPIRGSRGSLPDSATLRSWAAPSGGKSDSDLVSACRRYSWRVANAAYTISDEQIQKMSALGLTDGELLDLTLSTALFSALAIVEPVSAAVAPRQIEVEELRSRAVEINRHRVHPHSPAPLAAASTAGASEAG